MAAVFKDIPIEDLCKKVTAGSTPLRSRTDYYDGGTIDWYKTGELEDWYLGPANERITERALEETSVKLFPANTVLMAMYGDGKTITSMGMLRSPAATNQACSAMLVDEEKCDPRYFFYALKGRRDLLLKVASGGAQRNLSGKLIKEFRLPVPPLPIQQRIAGILSAYDELIENSQRRIKILESMARALYREWFVHFRFPGHENHPRVSSPLGEIPQGWEVSEFRDIFDIRYGKTLPKIKISDSGPFPVYGAGNVIGYYDKMLYPQKCALVTSRGNGSGTVWRTRGAAFVTNNSLILLPKENRHYWDYSFVELLLKHSNVMGAKTGSAQPQVTIENLNYVTAIVPTKPLIERFCSVATPIYEQVDLLYLQIQNLRRTRDLLLPRLLSGQINLEAIA